MENVAMTGQQTQEHLEMRWAPVTDRRGHTHMEAHWITSDQAVDQAVITHHAA